MYTRSVVLSTKKKMECFLGHDYNEPNFIFNNINCLIPFKPLLIMRSLNKQLKNNMKKHLQSVFNTKDIFEKRFKIIAYIFI